MSWFDGITFARPTHTLHQPCVPHCSLIFDALLAFERFTFQKKNALVPLVFPPHRLFHYLRCLCGAMDQQVLSSVLCMYCVVTSHVLVADESGAGVSCGDRTIKTRPHSWLVYCSFYMQQCCVQLFVGVLNADNATRKQAEQQLSLLEQHAQSFSHQALVSLVLSLLWSFAECSVSQSVVASNQSPHIRLAAILYIKNYCLRTWHVNDR